jgi:cytochrome c-type biogenesis protein CcmH/NrfG
MELYTKGDWAGALPGLRAAAALDPEAPQVAFYLGATALLAGRTDEAIVALRATVALGDTPVLEEARFYLARAAFRQGDIAAARTELAALVALGGERRAAAERLLDSLGESTKAAP